MSEVDWDAATAVSVDPLPQTWPELLELVRASPEPRFAEGPWNGSYLPPMVHRTESFSFEPLSPRVRLLDHAAYMTSVEHLNQAQDWGWPGLGITDEHTWLDMWTEWVKFGRGEAFDYAALTHARDREIGCAYLWQNEHSVEPREADLLIWVVEEALRDDGDLRLLTDFIAWIEAEWDFDRIVHLTPKTYRRGLDVAAAAGLARVADRPSLPAYACFEWLRGSDEEISR